jgi:hypothetical protein
MSQQARSSIAGKRKSGTPFTAVIAEAGFLEEGKKEAAWSLTSVTGAEIGV